MLASQTQRNFEDKKRENRIPKTERVFSPLPLSKVTQKRFGASKK